MTRSLPAFIIALLLACSGATAQTIYRSNVHIGLIYPLSSNWIYAPSYTNIFSLHALGGVSGGERAFCAAGVTNVVRGSATGLIAAGFSNHIMEEAAGLQAAGFVNTIRKEAKGFTAAGFANIAGSGKGMQAAGFGNITLRNMEGVQAAGFINTAADVNTQLAGFINIARNVKGIQLSGFINIADSNDYPIGIVNIIRNGEKGLGVTVDETGTTLLSFRSGGHVLYGILGVGVNFREDLPLYALEAGLGACLRVTPHFRIRAEGVAVSLADFEPGSHIRSSLRILPALKIGRQLEVFAGPTCSQVTLTEHKGEELAPGYLWELNRNGYFYGLYLGGMGGVQFHF